MNHIKKIIISGFIGILMATAVFIPMKFSGNTIVAYIATLIAIIELTASVIIVGQKNSKLHIDFVFPNLALNYLIWNLLISILILGLEKFDIYTLAVGWFLAIHIILIGVFAIKMMALESGKEHIEQVEVKVKQTTNSMMKLRLKSENIVNFAQDKNTRKITQNIADLIRYSDPVSCEESVELENEIEVMLNNLGNAVKIAKGSEIMQLSDNLTNIINQRNNIIKMSKATN